jgi:hypothetical protein
MTQDSGPATVGARPTRAGTAGDRVLTAPPLTLTDVMADEVLAIEDLAHRYVAITRRRAEAEALYARWAAATVARMRQAGLTQEQISTRIIAAGGRMSPTRVRELERQADRARTVIRRVPAAPTPLPSDLLRG